MVPPLPKKDRPTPVTLVETAVEASYYVSPRDPGLDLRELVFVGQALGFTEWQIRDAVQGTDTIVPGLNGRHLLTPERPPLYVQIYYRWQFSPRDPALHERIAHCIRQHLADHGRASTTITLADIYQVCKSTTLEADREFAMMELSGFLDRSEHYVTLTTLGVAYFRDFETVNFMPGLAPRPHFPATFAATSNAIAVRPPPPPRQQPSDSTSMTTPSMGIFFSHATKDNAVTNAFVEKILILGMGIESGSIFNVSDVDQGVPTGQYFVPYIRDVIQKSAVVVAWITPRYTESSFCMCELGAAWALSHGTLPFFPLIDDLTFAELPGVLSGMQVLKASEEARLDKFRDELAPALGIQAKQKGATWSRYKAEFLAAYPSLRASVPAVLTKPTPKNPVLKSVKALLNSLRASESSKTTMPLVAPGQATQFNRLLQEAKDGGVNTRVQPLPASPGGHGVHFGLTATPLSELLSSLEMLAAELDD